MCRYRQYRQLSIGWLSVCTKLKIKEFANIPQTPNQQSMKEFLNDLGVKGDAPGVCWDSHGVIYIFCTPHGYDDIFRDERRRNGKYEYPHKKSVFVLQTCCIYIIHLFFSWINIGGLIQYIA